MAVPPESVEVGKCYLLRFERPHGIRRVVRIMADGRVHFEDRRGGGTKAISWKQGLTRLRDFALIAEHEGPCDWTPERDNEERGTR